MSKSDLFESCHSALHSHCVRDDVSCVPNRYKKPEERQPLVAAMHIFMPMLKDRFIQLLPDHTIDSVLVQKQIFKILYALFQVMDAHNRLTFGTRSVCCCYKIKIKLLYYRLLYFPN